MTVEVVNRETPPALSRFAWLSVCAALATIGLKSAAYWVTGSVGLLADAAESLINLVAALVSLWMLSVAAKPADAGHPFGHGKAEYFASGFEGFLIIIAAGGISWAAWGRWQQPQPLAELNIGIAVSAAAGLLNLAVALVLLRAGRRYKSIALEADGRHLLTDVWTTVAVLAALAGIAWTGELVLDPIIAWVASVHIGWAGVVLVHRSLAGLLDAAIPADEQIAIESILERYRERGVEFHDLRTRAAGSQRLVTIHVLLPGEITVRESHALIETLEADIRAAVSNVTIVTHAEPIEEAASYTHDHLPPPTPAEQRGGGTDSARGHGFERLLGALGLAGGGIASMLTAGIYADLAMGISLLGLILLMLGMRAERKRSL